MPTDLGYGPSSRPNPLPARPPTENRRQASKLATTSGERHSTPPRLTAPCARTDHSQGELGTEHTAHHPFLGGSRKVQNPSWSPPAATGSSLSARTACGPAASSPPPPTWPGILSALIHSNVLSNQEDQVCHINPPSVQNNTDFTTKG